MNPNPNRLTAAQKSRGFVSPEDATPEIPLWRIVRTDKSARFTYGERAWAVRYDCHTAFRFQKRLYTTEVLKDEDRTMRIADKNAVAGKLKDKISSVLRAPLRLLRMQDLSMQSVLVHEEKCNVH